MRSLLILCGVLCVVALMCSPASAQVVTYYYSPVTTYYSPVTTYYAPSPVYASPAPRVVYRPAPVVVYRPAPVYVSPAPVVSYRYPVYYPGVVRTKVYYPGQPIRNYFKAITP